MKRWWYKASQSGPGEWGRQEPMRIIEDHEAIRRIRLTGIIISTFAQLNDLDQFKPQLAERVGVQL